MKNALDYDIHYNYLEGQNFIQCFASAYTFLEMKTNAAEFFSDPDAGGHCVGCGSGGEKHSCKKDKAAAKRCAFFALFNTMCGNSSMRRRFDGSPTDMQKRIGDTDEEGHNCGSDFTVDFLFGYAGYEYRKITDKATFKREIVASIDAGKPVVAKVKSENLSIILKYQLENSYFDVITGYDGDALAVHHNFAYDFSTNPPTLKPEKTPTYDELEALYIFGDKTTRRHTLKDGLENIRRVMEYNINAGLWDEYLKKLGADELAKASPEEKESRAKNLAATNMYMYNICSFNGAFGCEKLPNHYLHKELLAPDLVELWGNMNDPHWAILNAGHKTGKLNREKIWLIDDPAKIAALSAEVCEAIANAKEADVKLFEIINQALDILVQQPPNK